MKHPIEQIKDTTSKGYIPKRPYATLVLFDMANLSTDKRKAIADWLIQKASDIQDGEEVQRYNKVFTARFEQ